MEIVTWWASGAEQDGLFTIVRAFEKSNPQVEFFDSSVRGDDGVAARLSLRARLDAGNPPDVLMVSGGSGIAGYLERGELESLQTFYQEHNLSEVLRPELVELLGGGEPFALAADVHRANVLWSSSSVLESVGLDPDSTPDTVSEFLDNLRVLRQSGLEYPLAVGGSQSQVQLFDVALLSSLGGADYTRLWKEPDLWADPRVQRAADDYMSLLAYSDPRDRARDDVRVAMKVAYGDAAYAVLVDTALTTFNRAGLSFARDYQARPFPGTKGTFATIVDAFAIPTGATHPRSALDWLETVSTPAVQVEVSVAKGSIPARADIDAPSLPPYQQSSLFAFQQDVVVPSGAGGLAADEGWTRAYREAVEAFGRDSRTDAFVLALRSAAVEGVLAN